MCNLYNLTTTRDAVVEFTKAMADKAGWNEPSLNVYPNTLAPIVRVGDDGNREIVSATWGMPTPPAFVKGKADRGVTNIRNVGSPHWRRWLGPTSRCVVPFTSFAEPDPASKVGERRQGLLHVLAGGDIGMDRTGLDGHGLARDGDPGIAEAAEIDNVARSGKPLLHGRQQGLATRHELAILGLLHGLDGVRHLGGTMICKVFHLRSSRLIQRPSSWVALPSTPLAGWPASARRGHRGHQLPHS